MSFIVKRSDLLRKTNLSSFFLKFRFKFRVIKFKN